MSRQRLKTWVLGGAVLAACALATLWVLGNDDSAAPAPTVTLAAPAGGETGLPVDASLGAGPPSVVRVAPTTGRERGAEADPAGAAATGQGGTPSPPDSGSFAGTPGDLEGPSASGPAGPAPTPSVAVRPVRLPHFSLVRIVGRRDTPLSRRPGGPAVTRISARTEFGSPVVLGVAARRGEWIGFPTPKLPNGALGWVRFDPARMDLYWTRYSLGIDLSSRRLTVRYGQRPIARWPVTVGAPGSETPEGRYSVTDALAFESSPYYGCCALALSGHQPKLPVGWLGGSRVAIHGTIGPVGEALSHGCIRATNATMRELFRRVPLGAPVFVSA